MDTFNTNRNGGYGSMKLEEYMEYQDPEKLKAIMEIGGHKYVKAYNTMCRPCKHLVSTNSSRPMSDYCDKCQEMFNKLLR